MKNLILILLSAIFLMSCSEEETEPPKENWEESSTFVKEMVVTEEGQQEDFVFRIGNNGKFGFGEYGPFIADNTQKYMWLFWGKQDTLTKPFRVEAVSKNTNESIIIFENASNHSLTPHLGADHQIPSSLTLPHAGKWRLEAYFGEELFGHIVVYVQES